MQGIKVYLKSGFEGIFRIFLVITGLILLVNGLKQFEVEHRPVLEVFTNCTLGLVMMGTAFLHKKLNQKLGFIPPLLFIAAAGFLFWNAERHLALYPSAWFTWMHRISFLVAGIGILCPILNRRRAAYFSPRRIRLPKFISGKKVILWKEVQDIDMGDQSIQLALNNGDSMTIYPNPMLSQILRSRIDAIRIASQAPAAQKKTPSEKAKPSLSRV